MAIRGAARAVARAARCGSAGLRPAAPAASETRTAAVFILHWTCVRSVSSSDLVSPAACRDCSPMAQRVVRFCSLVMLSGSLRRSIATMLLLIAVMACGACDTSNMRLEDAGADHKTDLL